VARWREQPDPFPVPLREFREEEWPPVPGECLGWYACRGEGYDGPCVPRPGEPCGQRCHDRLALECAPEVLAAAKAADAFTRYHKARLAWLGKDHPGWLDEFIDGDRHHEIRRAPFRTAP
jgi:hypothetical protein